MSIDRQLCEPDAIAPVLVGSRHRAISIPTVGLHSVGENTGSYSPVSSLQTDGVLSEGMKSRVDSIGKRHAHPQALVFFTWFERV